MPALVFTILPKINRAESRARPAVAARFLRTSGPLLVVIFVLVSSRSAVATEPAPRETVLFNTGWLFQSGDPNGPHDSLDYAHLRSWLLPSGDACLSASAGHHRPDGNPGQEVPYTQNEFDDDVDGEITNNVKTERVTVLLSVVWYDKNGKVIAESTPRVDNLAPGEARPFQASTSKNPEIKSYGISVKNVY